MTSASSPPQSQPDLTSPAVMLETLKMAYQFVLDTLAYDFELQPRRLNDEQGRELGRRLGMYHAMELPQVMAKDTKGQLATAEENFQMQAWPLTSQDEAWIAAAAKDPEMQAWVKRTFGDTPIPHTGE